MVSCTGRYGSLCDFTGLPHPATRDFTDLEQGKMSPFVNSFSAASNCCQAAIIFCPDALFVPKTPSGKA
jgi:hypothetical protein